MSDIARKLDTIESMYGYVDADLRLLLESFSEVLIDLGEQDLADFLDCIQKGQIKEGMELDERSIQALSMYFQFLNMVEENTANHFRRKEEESSDGQLPGHWNHRIKQCLKLGLSVEELCQQISNVHFEPVLTDHPTEAKPPQILTHNRELYLLLLKIKSPRWSSQ